MKEEYCVHCGQMCSKEEIYYVDDEVYCERCANRSTFICEECGERFPLDANFGDADIPLCERCYNCGDYYVCSECGHVITSNEAYSFTNDESSYCRDCYEQRRNQRTIQEYTYKPVPIFYGEGPRFFGVELELDDGGNNELNAGILLDCVNTSDRQIYIKHDSSLNDGFEVVTHPMSLSYHKYEMPWLELCDKAIDMDYLSHKTDTCGLHIHVNRSSLGNTYMNQEATISKILLIMEKFWPEMVRFSRRTSSQLDRWAQRYGFEKRGKEILDKAKKKTLGRYASINLENSETIEFRIFRGTLKVNTILAALELTDQFCEYAVHMEEEEIHNLSWTDFVTGLPSSCPELIQYLKERRLYVNAPVEEEEEL